MGAFLWLKSPNKVQIGVLIGFSVLVLVPIMPEAWVERMQTIRTYDEDASAMGRFNAWGMAINLASARIFGGGFDTFQRAQFAQYAPDPAYQADAHSIYFEVLGEHGFVGLGLFLALGLSTWMASARIRRATETVPDLSWMATLARMVQVSLVAYATTGAFLGMAYFDYAYNLVLILVVCEAILASRRTTPLPATAGLSRPTGHAAASAPRPAPQSASRL
jgi:probable O-glycosylation ligase (exosortase A-associated)